MVAKAQLKGRLRTRAEAFVSDPDLVTDDYLDIAITEAQEIAPDVIQLALLTDIAYYRFLLLVETNGVSESDFNAYQYALKQVATINADNGGGAAHGVSTVKQRSNGYC